MRWWRKDGAAACNMVQISTKVALQNLLRGSLIEVWGQSDDVEELKQSCPAISKFHDGQHG